MPSDPRLETLCGLVADADARYRATVAAAADQVAAYLDSRRASADQAELPDQLGRFATGRISETRFASLFEPEAVAPAGLEPMERAASVLADVLTQSSTAPVALPRGGDLGRLVDDLLTRAGRAFGAALLFQAARAGAYRPEQHDRLLEGISFSRWNRNERLLAPPLMILLDGGDAWVDGLSAYLDGSVKLLLVIEPPCPPAPLVRLITPGVFVMQSSDPARLERLMAAQGAGIGALVPEGAAEFVHDPSAGPAPGQRLSIDRLPAELSRASVGGRSAWQQQDELRQLQLLAEMAAAMPAPVSMGSSAGGASPVDTLASWLLMQAGLAPVGEAPVT